MKKITVIKNLMLVMIVCSLTSCDRETILNPTEVPIEITSYVSTHFPNNRMLQTTKEIDGTTKTYNVILNDNISLEFNRKKRIISIEANSQLPEGVIPEKLNRYVSSNYPNNYIIEWEIESKQQQISLDNNLDLEFSLNGDFLRIDN